MRFLLVVVLGLLSLSCGKDYFIPRSKEPYFSPKCSKVVTCNCYIRWARWEFGKEFKKEVKWRACSPLENGVEVVK